MRVTNPMPDGRAQFTDEWRVIENPITGEVLTFLLRTPAQVVFDVEFPAGGVPVVLHSHPGTESFEVIEGDLRLTVADQIHDLGEGQTYTVRNELHSPANVSGRVARVRVTCAGGKDPLFAERGLRGAFGMARDGRTAPDGRPKDLLAMALLSENGKYYTPIMPKPVWVAANTALGVVAKLTGKKKILEGYWPPDLPRPWGRQGKSRG